MAGDYQRDGVFSKGVSDGACGAWFAELCRELRVGECVAGRGLSTGGKDVSGERGQPIKVGRRGGKINEFALEVGNDLLLEGLEQTLVGPCVWQVLEHAGFDLFAVGQR